MMKMKSKRDMQSRDMQPRTIDIRDEGLKAKLDNNVTVTEEDRSLDISLDTGGNPSSTAAFTFRNMSRQDYFSLYDAIHRLVRQEEISKEQENMLYDMIGRQHKGLAAAYKKYKDSDEHDPLVLIEPLKEKMSRARSSQGAQV
eukprot:CAMPEP_0181295406 /NCGR_PEP_ID=MMETSP1101-20121128/4134_1 /TAXON_ID=46948 /ORGANISM="Rhodomonas abbreviata, Strain Caron Lab Isolate" /LENGTH=142 /DNA_ID=CAMNT_0023400163 /DNA_START=132 /DNA_END=560 /DNA_ORIENTATION=+